MRIRPAFVLFLLALSGALTALAPAPASAATSCEISSGTIDLDFCAVDTLSGPAKSGAADIGVSCSDVPENVPAITICGFFGAGSGGADGDTRLLAGPDGTLSFNLYAGHAGGTQWGDGGALGQPQLLTLPVSDGQASGDIWVYGLASGPATTIPGHFQLDPQRRRRSVLLRGRRPARLLGARQPEHHRQPRGHRRRGSNCLVAADPLNFDPVGIIDHVLTAASNIHVTCTPGTQFQIALDGGTSNAASPEERQMRSGANSITYGLYSDMSRNQPWGEGAQATGGAGAGEARAYTVYGRVPIQPAPVGNYTDTVVVTISYDP